MSEPAPPDNRRLDRFQKARREERLKVPVAPAEAYPPGLFIKEEMDARGWTSADVAARMGGATAYDRKVDQLTIDLIIQIHDDKDSCRIGEKTAKALARAFDVSAEYFLNLEASWVAFRAARKVTNVSERKAEE